MRSVPVVSRVRSAEARRLVTPYGFVRHPLYLFELLGVIGILLQVRSLSGITRRFGEAGQG